MREPVLLSPPSPAELAAIVVAVEQCWPTAPAADPDRGRDGWRWSGRWWSDRRESVDRRRPWR